MAEKKQHETIEVEHKGRKIVLPSDPTQMSNDTAIEHLKRLSEQEKQVVAIYEKIDCFPLEGSYALTQVLRERYGWVNTEPTPGMFGDKPPVMVSFEIGYKKTAQVFWGGFSVPGVKGQLQTSAEEESDGLKFVISGKVLKKFQGEIQAIANEVRNFISTKSVYKGKAIRVSTVESDNYENTYILDRNNPPSFMNMEDAEKTELIFGKETMAQIQASIFTPLQKTQACRDLGIPLKRGVLLEGPFGTGKTLTAQVTSKIASDNGWTFIYLDRVAAFKDILLFARKYMPCVIFAEDIDRAIPVGRTVDTDDILNHIDGIDSKNTEIMCVFTTNNVEKIERAMLRPGRLDAVIHVAAPDAEAAEKLMRLYGRGLIKEDEDLSAAAQELKGQIPASIREVVERSKLYALYGLPEGEKLKLTGEAIRHAAIGIKAHLAMINPAPEVPAVSLNEAVGSGMAAILWEKMKNQKNVTIRAQDMQ